jgi:VIT1/CCC1 family predicted Fe2+/Mn2+ transporter
MARAKRHREHHRGSRAGWLRASVLGANDGIVSTAALIVGVAAAGTAQDTILLSGLAGLVAGAVSMAAGEYVSVQSQADLEKADLSQEQEELDSQPEAELRELSSIYVTRGLDPALARQVAEQLSAHDALGAHARDELGITVEQAPRPILAALSSAASFTAGALLPLVLVMCFRGNALIPAVAVGSLLLLAVLGAVAANVGGAGMIRGALRVTFWGALALALTASLGTLFGISL